MKRAESRQRNNTALIEAALAEMAAHGYRAARLEDIAARAGLTTGAVYSRFGGKRQLLLATVEHLARLLRDRLAELTEQDLTLHEALRGYALVTYRLALDENAAHWYAFEVEAAGLAAHDEELADAIATHASEITALLTHLLTGRVIDPGRRPARRTTPAQAARLTPAVRALTIGLAQQAIRTPDAVAEHYVVDATAALAHLLAP
ncbi:TetR/AcrR family transcriptional regulator [Amycolatopsis sp. NPDC059021]|uniref:TetR/AcrR family transcriptional regulator n=1 Tax=Amycolatopsis sp. NPDC059021 TaxID=3346704 RepID=UPI00366E4537